MERFKNSRYRGWTYLGRYFRLRYVKEIACYLFGKENPDKSMLDVRVCLCTNTEPERQRLEEDYKDFVKLDVGWNNLVVVRGSEVYLSSYIELPDGTEIRGRVFPEQVIFRSAYFETELVRQAAYFEVNMMPFFPSGTKVVCLVDNGERRASFKSSTRLQFYLKDEFSKEDPIANKFERGTKNTEPRLATYTPQINEPEKTEDSGIVYKQEKGYPKALRNERAKNCLEPLYIECSECSLDLFKALKNECSKWSGVLCCESFAPSLDHFTLAIRDDELFHLHIRWHSNLIKIILETQTDSVSTELWKTLSGKIRQFLETILELLRTKFQNIAGMRCVFKVQKREESSICNVHKLKGCLDENCIQISPIGWGPEASSRNWSYRDEDRKDAPTPVDLFRLSLDVNDQWQILGQFLGLAESVQTLLDQDQSDNQLRCFKLLMMWLKVGSSVTFQTLGNALVEMKRDDLFLKHCKEEKQLPKWFTITPKGGQVSYLGCTIDIPEGSIESEAQLCLGFLKTGPPEGDCVAPVLHVQTMPSNLSLKKPVTMTLPVFVSPVKPDESSQPEFTLMCFQEGLWKEVPSPKLRFFQTSFEVSHFSGWTIVIENYRLFYRKNIACYLFGKENPEKNLLDMRLCVCGYADAEIERLQEGYRSLGFVKLDVGRNNLVVTWGYDVVITSCIQTLDGAPCTARVTQPEQVFKSTSFEGELVRQVAYFKVNRMHSPEPTGTTVFCRATNGRPPHDSSTRLSFCLKECVENEDAYEIMEGATLHVGPPNSTDGTVEDCVKNEEAYDGKNMVFLAVFIAILAVAMFHLSPGLFGGLSWFLRGSSDKTVQVLLLSSEWGSSKGGLSTFNRELAINLHEQSNINVSCYLPHVSDADKKAAKKYGVTLIEAEPVPGDRNALQKLKQLPTKLQSPDVIISHGRKFGSAAYLIKKMRKICKWVHFVHVDFVEMGKYKVGDNEMNENNVKDEDELELCKAADVVVAVGPQLLDSYSRSLSSKRKRVHKFYPGLINEFRNLNVKNVENLHFHIYIFGRSSPEDFEVKGVDVIADAVRKLGDDYRLKIVGVPEDKEKKFTQHILNTTRIKKRQLSVYAYCKSREEMKDKMCEADLVVMPSRAEAFGLIGLEALSAGVPVLVSSASGLGITLRNFTFGDSFVVESDDAQEWAKKIESLKKKKISQRIDEVKHIRNQYDEKYKWEDQCSRLVQLFLDD